MKPHSKEVISIKIVFTKLLHTTDKAILIDYQNREIWLPKVLCKDLRTKNNLSGTVILPAWFLKKNKIAYKDQDIYKEIIHHIPDEVSIIESNISYESELFR